MKKKLLLVGVIIFIGCGALWAHCEVPCGIYDDTTQMRLLYEDIATIEKSMNEINQITTNKTIDYNQLVRWITTKDEHAQKIQMIVAQYFLTQRIKMVKPDSSGYSKYIQELTLLHQMLVWAMKTKQTTDIESVKKLREVTHSFEKSYFGLQMPH